MTTAPLRIAPTPSEAALTREPIQFPGTLNERAPFRATRKPIRDHSFLAALIDCTEEQCEKERDAEKQSLIDPDEQRRREDEAKIRRDVAEERRRQDAERQKQGILFDARQQ